MNRRDWLRNTLAGAAAQASDVGTARDMAADTDLHCGNSLITILLLRADSAVWALAELSSSRTYRCAPPIFEIDGHLRLATLTGVRSRGEPLKLPNGVSEFLYSGIFASDPRLSLDLVFRIAPDSPVARFRYIPHSTADRTLTASGKTQHLRYLMDSLALLGPILTGADAAGNTLLDGMKAGVEGETGSMTKHARTTKQSKKGQAAAEKRWTVGIDLGDQWSRYCVLDEEGEIAEEGRFKTTPGALRKHFADSERMRIALEAGTHSLWVSEHLGQLGHEVLVANAREIRAITHSDSKSDQLDAEKLARYARVDPKILHPIRIAVWRCNVHST